MQRGGKGRGVAVRVGGLVGVTVAGVLAGLGPSAYAATPRGGTAASPPVALETAGFGGTAVVGADADGTYGTTGFACGRTDEPSQYPLTLQTWSASGTSTGCVTEASGGPVAGLSYSGGAFVYTAPGPSTGSNVVHVVPVADTAFQIGTSDALVGLAGPAHVLTESAAGVLTLRGGPGEAPVVLASGLPAFDRQDVAAAGGVLRGADGHLYAVDLGASTVTAVPGVSGVVAADPLGGPGAPVAVLTSDRHVERVASDGTTSHVVTVPGTDALTWIAGTSAATFVASATTAYVGTLDGPLHAIGLVTVSGLAAGAGTTAYAVGQMPTIDADGTEDGPVAAYRISTTTSPPPTVVFDSPTGTSAGRVDQVQVHIDQDTTWRLDRTTWSDAYAGQDGNTPLPPGPHSVTVVVDAATGRTTATSTFTVVAHDVSATLGTNHHVYLFDAGSSRAIDLGGYGVSAPTVGTAGHVTYVVVEGTDGSTYLRTPTTPWVRFIDDRYGYNTCRQPSLAMYQIGDGTNTIIACGDGHGAVVDYGTATTATVEQHPQPVMGLYGAAEDRWVVPSGLSGGPVDSPGGLEALGRDSYVYVLDNATFVRLGPRCAGPIGGAGVVSGLGRDYGGIGITGCRQANGSLLVWRTSGGALVGEQSLGGGVVGQPGVALLGDGSAVVTVVGTDKAVYRNTLTASGAASGWVRVSAAAIDGISGGWVDGP